MPLRRRGKSHECFILKNSESYHKRILADIGCNRSQTAAQKSSQMDIVPVMGLVAVRLLCPVSLESVLSILPSAKVVPDNIEMVQDPHIDSGVRIIDNAVNPVIEKSFSPDAASSVNPMQVVVFMGSIIWLTGMTVMLLYALISYILLRRKVRASVAMNDRVKECKENLLLMSRSFKRRRTRHLNQLEISEA